MGLSKSASKHASKGHAILKGNLKQIAPANTNLAFPRQYRVHSQPKHKTQKPDPKFTIASDDMLGTRKTALHHHEPEYEINKWLIHSALQEKNGLSLNHYFQWWPCTNLYFNQIAKNGHQTWRSIWASWHLISLNSKIRPNKNCRIQILICQLWGFFGAFL